MELCEKASTTNMISAKPCTSLEIKLAQMVDTVKAKSNMYLIINKHQFYNEVRERML